MSDLNSNAMKVRFQNRIPIAMRVAKARKGSRSERRLQKIGQHLIDNGDSEVAYQMCNLARAENPNMGNPTWRATRRRMIEEKTRELRAVGLLPFAFSPFWMFVFKAILKAFLNYFLFERNDNVDQTEANPGSSRN